MPEPKFKKPILETIMPYSPWLAVALAALLVLLSLLLTWICLC